MTNFFKKNLLYFAWMIALASTLGSLYFSNVRNFPPCVLCWYQRIFMYPLVIIIAVGIWRKDRFLHYYVLPMSLIGGAIAFYHNLLYYQILPESAAPCLQGVSCTTKFIEYFGFVTIPFLSFVSFAFITLLILIYKKLNHEVK